MCSAAIIEIKPYQTFDSCLTEREIDDNRDRNELWGLGGRRRAAGLLDIWTTSNRAEPFSDAVRDV